MTLYSWCFYWLIFFGIILARYLIIAGGFYFFFYQLRDKTLNQAESLEKYTEEKHTEDKYTKKPINRIRWDIQLSIQSTTIFALTATSIVWLYESKRALLYTELQKYGTWYLVVSFVSSLFLQDTYFYFIHRAFHHPRLFRWLHFGHHRSGKPTPWTSFAFDLPEAIAQAIFLVGLVFIIPLHFITLGALMMTMTIWAVITHVGFQWLAPSSMVNWLGTWLIGSVHHSIHHRNYKSNYGLYFTFWDRVFDTQYK